MSKVFDGVVIEGIDASGKATHAKLLADIIGARVIAFPNYETETGRAILNHLRGEWQAPSQIDMLVRQALMLANRCEVAHKLDEGPIVLDRYYLSGIVYGAVEQIDKDWLWRIHEVLPQPKFQVLIDIPVEESVRRRPDRRDKNEQDLEKLSRVREEYMAVFSTFRPSFSTIATVDGTGTIEQVHRRIRAAIGICEHGDAARSGDWCYRCSGCVEKFGNVWVRK